MLLTRLKIAAVFGVLLSVAGAATGPLLSRTQAAGQSEDPPMVKPPATELPQPPQAKPAPKPGPILKGRIVDETGRPLPGVKVVLYGGFATRWRMQETTMDRNGEYRFDPLQSGSMIKDQAKNRWDLSVGIQLSHPTHASADGKSWWDVRVPGVDRHEYIRDFAMTPGGRLEGRVLDDAGKPCAGLDLRVHGPAKPKTVHRYATTDADGKFQVEALFPGEYDVDINDSVRGYPVIGQARVAAGQTATLDLRDAPWDPDFPKLTGAWAVVRAEGQLKQSGKEYTIGGTMTFRRGLVELRDGARNLSFRVGLNSSRRPKEIDLFLQQHGEMPNWIHGVYELDGDSLRISLSAKGERPASFDAPAGSGRHVLLLRRAPQQP